MGMDTHGIAGMGRDTGKLLGPAAFNKIAAHRQKVQCFHAARLFLGRYRESQSHVGHKFHGRGFAVIMKMCIKKFHFQLRSVSRRQAPHKINTTVGVKPAMAGGMTPPLPSTWKT